MASKETDPELSIGNFTSYDDYWRAWYHWDRRRILAEAKEHADDKASAYGGIGIGSGIAVVLSFQLNHSIWLMIVNGICSMALM